MRRPFAPCRAHRSAQAAADPFGTTATVGRAAALQIEPAAIGLVDIVTPSASACPRLLLIVRRPIKCKTVLGCGSQPKLHKKIVFNAELRGDVGHVFSDRMLMAGDTGFVLSSHDDRECLPPVRHALLYPTVAGVP